MKKKEKADIIVKNRVVYARDATSDVPKITFITNMKKPKKSPPRSERNQRPAVLARTIAGI